jgi:hypothetical protein
VVRYERTEVGRGLNAVLIVAVAVMLASFLPVVLEVISGKSHPGILAVLVMPLIITGIVLPGISKLHVQLSDETLNLRMGIFSRKINLRDVTNVSIISVLWWSGWGVRYSFIGGELWRVNGTRGIKLELRNRSSFTFGLNDPDSLERVIKNMLERSLD